MPSSRKSPEAVPGITMNQPKNIKGLRIRTINFVLLAISLFLFAIVLYTTVQISIEYKNATRLMNIYMDWERAARSIKFGSDYLTDQARLYVSTGNVEFIHNYFRELDKDHNREKALEILAEKKLHLDHDENECEIKKALDLSNKLAQKEIYALRLMAEAKGEDLTKLPSSLKESQLTAKDSSLDNQAKAELAKKLLFDVAYQKEKGDILATISKFIEDNIVVARTQQKLQNEVLGDVIVNERIMLIVLCFLNIITFAMIIILIVRPLKVYLKNIQEDKMLEVIGAYEFKHLALTYNDIFALKEYQDKILRDKAEHDPLTGLFNRSAFDSISLMFRDTSEPMGLLLIDVDKFKNINDTYGHIVGDQVLRRVAAQLKHNFRSDDFCIRMGGDEFAVIFNAPDPGLEEIVLNKIRHINKFLLHPKDDLPPVSLSVGGVISEKGFPETMYQDADAALYEVKEAGRCGCLFSRSASETPQKDNE